LDLRRIEANDKQKTARGVSFDLDLLPGSLGALTASDCDDDKRGSQLHKTTEDRFQRDNSRFSRSNAFSLSAVSVGTPARCPLSTSAFLTQSCSACGVQPILAEINITAAQSDGCSLA
jgi:hypothetical protein